MPRTSNSSANPDRKATGAKDGSHMRSKSTIKRLNMYRGGKPFRNKEGKIVGGDLLSKHESGNQAMGKMARIAPNRKWFGNTRVIGQKELDEFRAKMTEKVEDPYTVLLRRKNLPMGLLVQSNEGLGGKAVRLDGVEEEGSGSSSGVNLNIGDKFDKVFGPKKTRKRPNVTANSLQDLVSKANKSGREYEGKKPEEDEGNVTVQKERSRVIAREEVFSKGQSKRIWQELHKVIDSSDVIVQVLDARDPYGTKSTFLETHIKDNCPHKHMILLLNKIDLIPSYLSKHYIQQLSKTHPTLGFHASITKSFGKGSLIQLLRQFAALHPEKQNISVGFVGFPNSGKSSIINTLKSKKVCMVAPIPGQTRVWQYITLFKRVFLIDCPGVVYPEQQSEESDLVYEAKLLMKGVVRAEKLESPEEYIPEIFKRVKPSQLIKTYGIAFDGDVDIFMTALARKRGRLLKGGEPDIRSVAQSIIYDLQRGRLVYFVVPEDFEERPRSKK